MQAPGADTAAAVLAERFALPDSSGIEVLTQYLMANHTHPDLGLAAHEVSISPALSISAYGVPPKWNGSICVYLPMQELSAACREADDQGPHASRQSAEELASLLMSVPDRAPTSSLPALQPAAFAKQASVL